jgi:hypothetical protein
MFEDGRKKPAMARAQLIQIRFRHAFEKAIAIERAHCTAPWGYPVPTIKKNGACVVTYRHSGELLFENSFSPRSIVNEI